MRSYLRAGGDRRLAALRRFALSISAFNVVGHLFLGFEQAWLHPIVAVLWAYGVELCLEYLDAWARRRPMRFDRRVGGLSDFLLPAHISGMAISMLIYPGERFSHLIFAVTVCIASKYLLRAPVSGTYRHVFNPSNLGIVVTLIAFPSVGISPPYHFTENLYGLLDWLVPLAVLTSGLLLNHQLTGKMPLIYAWLGGFVAQAVVRSAVLETPMIPALLPITGFAFMLYTTYMITDPSTSPSSRQGQIAFGLALAAVYGLLVSSGIVFGLFFSLALVSAARAGILYITAAWNQTRPHKELPQQTASDAVNARELVSMSLKAEPTRLAKLSRMQLIARMIQD